MENEKRKKHPKYHSYREPMPKKGMMLPYIDAQVQMLLSFTEEKKLVGTG